ncbi:hypothetical protein ACYJ1Y_11680 [Natrialbaceae archaeon A-gly3]
MNRRTALRSTGVLVSVGLAGCLGEIENPFSLGTPIPIVIENESEGYYNIELLARDTESGTETFQEAYTTSPDERISPPNLRGNDQSLRVTLFESGGDREDAIVEAISVSERTQEVHIRIVDSGLEIELTEHENGDEENRTVNEADGSPENETTSQSENGTDDET